MPLRARSPASAAFRKGYKTLRDDSAHAALPRRPCSRTRCRTPQRGGRLPAKSDWQPTPRFGNGGWSRSVALDGSAEPGNGWLHVATCAGDQDVGADGIFVEV